MSLNASVSDQISQLYLKDALSTFEPSALPDTQPIEPPEETFTTKNPVSSVSSAGNAGFWAYKRDVLDKLPQPEQGYDPRPLFQRLAAETEKTDLQREEYYKELNLEKNRENREYIYSQIDEVKRLEDEVRRADQDLVDGWRREVGEENATRGIVEMDSRVKKIEKRTAGIDRQRDSVGASIIKRAKVEAAPPKIGLVAYSDSD